MQDRGKKLLALKLFAGKGRAASSHSSASWNRPRKVSQKDLVAGIASRLVVTDICHMRRSEDGAGKIRICGVVEILQKQLDLAVRMRTSGEALPRHLPSPAEFLHADF